MKRPILLIGSFAALLCVGTLPSFAQHGHGGGGTSAPHGTAVSHGPANSVSGRSSTAGGPKTPGELLQQNTRLSSKLGAILAKQGINIQDPATLQGFKNLGRFVAAVHVSQNLDIPFTNLQKDMMKGDSLGKAIHTEKPDVDSQAESKKGLKQANDDIKETETEPKSS